MSRTRANSKLKTRNSQLARLVPLLLSWFAQNARDLPWRRTRDPYAIWVSEIMLQQTQVKTVIAYWERWMHKLPTLEALANADPEKIHKLWEGLGYYARVGNMQKAAKQIVARHESLTLPRRRRGNEAGTRKELETPRVVSCKFPQNFDDILALPGIGRYTAGAICSIALNQPTPILDGNVIRVLARIFGIAENPRQKEANARLWQLAAKLVSRASCLNSPRRRSPEDHTPQPCSALNQSLMELGALICTPRSPHCHACPANKLCVAFHENRQKELPNLDKLAPVTQRRFMAFVVEREGKFLVRQRPAGVVNAQLWEFPNVEVGARACGPRRALAQFNALRATDTRAQRLEPFCTIKHSITRYRITLEVYRARAPVCGPARNASHARNAPDRMPALEGRWLRARELKKLSFPSAHKKILAALADVT